MSAAGELLSPTIWERKKRDTPRSFPDAAGKKIKIKQTDFQCGGRKKKDSHHRQGSVINRERWLSAPGSDEKRDVTAEQR